MLPKLLLQNVKLRKIKIIFDMIEKSGKMVEKIRNCLCGYSKSIRYDLTRLITFDVFR